MPVPKKYVNNNVMAMSKPKQELTSQHYQDFNDFNKYVESKGHKGDPRLDHDPALRNSLLADYKKANPNSTFNYDVLPQLQDALQQTKKNIITGGKKGMAQYPSNLMNNISKSDGIYGQQTSSNPIPASLLITKNKDSKGNILSTGVTDTGFSGNPALAAFTNSSNKSYPIYANENSKQIIAYSQTPPSAALIESIRKKKS